MDNRRKARMRRSRSVRISSVLSVAVVRDMDTLEPTSVVIFRGRRRSISIDLAPGVGVALGALLSSQAVTS